MFRLNFAVSSVFRRKPILRTAISLGILLQTATCHHLPLTVSFFVRKLLSGKINWNANVVNAENVNHPGSVAATYTSKELKFPSLIILISAISF